MDALNVRRSLCDQIGGKIVHWYLTSCCNDLQPAGEMPSFFIENALLKLCQSGSCEEPKAFLWFYGEFLECVSRKRAWGYQKYQRSMISSATCSDTQQPVMTISDEEFGLLLIENYIANGNHPPAPPCHNTFEWAKMTHFFRFPSRHYQAANTTT